MKQQVWDSLIDNNSKHKKRKISTLFEDKSRFKKFSAEGAGLFFDFSKTNIDLEAKNLLVQLIENSNIPNKRKEMFSGEIINKSEKRAALHFALRSNDEILGEECQDSLQGIATTRIQMEQFVSNVRSGKVATIENKKFTDVINIGIGGSDLGPKMVAAALRPYHDGPKCHFVSNIDGADVADTLKYLNPKRTLVIIASKTFTTIETITNAQSVISWLKRGISGDITQHLVGVSSALSEAKKMGIATERIFSFPDSIGGRYSIWGPIGLSVMIAVGVDNFLDFLSGAEKMDEHFLYAEPNQNLPILLGMVGLWHRNVCKYSTRAILPYEHRLSYLPAYLQQLDMESNGKSTSVDGNILIGETAPVVWGDVGTNGQHAFFQMLHQGTSIVPCEFLVGASGHEPDLKHQHHLLIANCLAQSESLMVGDQNENLAKSFSGNRPSTTILYPKLTPKVLGALIALYEHRTFVEGTVWNVNSFDQWGVELGKKMAKELLPMLRPETNSGTLNGSTAGLLQKILRY
jgi:glucose-6-phosphate isomerase